MQTSGGSLLSLATSYGGASSLFRGMAAPLSAACAINATIFASYGWSSRLYDQYIPTPENSKNPVHDPSIKAFSCGSFAGLVQCVVICPIEHLKCRLQVQHGKGAPNNIYKGPVQAARSIVKNYGISGLFRGWCVTSWREVPAFGLYFAIYDLAKDRINKFLEKDTSSSVVAKVTSPPSRGSLWSISCLCSIATLFCRNWSSFFKFYGHFSWLLNNSRSYLSHSKIKRSKGWMREVSQVSQLVHRKRIPSANATVRRRYYGRWEFCTPTSYLVLKLSSG